MRTLRTDQHYVTQILLSYTQRIPEIRPEHWTTSGRITNEATNQGIYKVRSSYRKRVCCNECVERSFSVLTCIHISQLNKTHDARLACMSIASRMIFTTKADRRDKKLITYQSYSRIGPEKLYDFTQKECLTSVRTHTMTFLRKDTFYDLDWKGLPWTFTYLNVSSNLRHGHFDHRNISEYDFDVVHWSVIKQQANDTLSQLRTTAKNQTFLTTTYQSLL